MADGRITVTAKGLWSSAHPSEQKDLDAVLIFDLRDQTVTNARIHQRDLAAANPFDYDLDLGAASIEGCLVYYRGHMAGGGHWLFAIDLRIGEQGSVTGSLLAEKVSEKDWQLRHASDRVHVQRTGAFAADKELAQNAEPIIGDWPEYTGANSKGEHPRLVDDITQARLIWASEERTPDGKAWTPWNLRKGMPG